MGPATTTTIRSTTATSTRIPTTTMGRVTTEENVPIIFVTKPSATTDFSTSTTTLSTTNTSPTTLETWIKMEEKSLDEIAEVKLGSSLASTVTRDTETTTHRIP